MTGETLSMNSPWWRKLRPRLLGQAARHGASYVYHWPTIVNRIQRLLPCTDRLFYAVKANAFPELLGRMVRAFPALGFECVSASECKMVLAAGAATDRILFTPNFAPLQEYDWALAAGIAVTVDNLWLLQHAGQHFSGCNIMLRLDLGSGRGHHQYVQTGGDQAKFGIPVAELDQVLRCCSSHNIRVAGLHTHCGSGIDESDHWASVGWQLAAIASDIAADHDIRALNVGGGLALDTDMKTLRSSLVRLREDISPAIWLEPGRYLVAEAGVLLARVTQRKVKGARTYVGVETGMNSLLRPALYGARHRVVNLTALGSDRGQETVTVVGPICESADVLATDTELAICEPDDVLLFENVGAYGAVMSSHYNARAPAGEYLMAGN